MNVMNNNIQMPDKLVIEENDEQSFGRFILQPLEKGYGVTLGNSFRRVLLSSITGTAIIGVKIAGVLHEFQTIPGVLEDMTEIILNLKEVRIKPADKKITKATFRLKGPMVWRAKHIEEACPQMKVMDPELLIATLAEDADLDVELRFGRGKGYIPADEEPTADFPVGMLPIDAVYTPISNVIYNIEPCRVGQKTDYEKLVLDVTSDGTVSPKEAVHYSAKVLQEHVKYFISDEDYEVEEEVKVSPEDEVKEAERQRLKKLLLTSVDDLELSVRAHNCLKAASIKNLSELVRLQEAELLKFRNFGRKSLSELSEVVKQYGLKFGMNVDSIIRDDSNVKHLDLNNVY